MMKENPRADLFDSWSENYDQDVSAGDFPFTGYQQVLERVLQDSSLSAGMELLELGSGTGNLTAQLVKRGCRVLALDFSAKMIEKARVIIPQARFVQADLLAGWPEELASGLFDRILSTYLFHEFELPVKLSLLSHLAGRLKPAGRIVIGDLSFQDGAARAGARAIFPDAWDEEEEPWAAAEDLAALAEAGLLGSYTQISSCGGVFIIQTGID
jgi:putative AdoMet-dependent methyltransferase